MYFILASSTAWTWVSVFPIGVGLLLAATGCKELGRRRQRCRHGVMARRQIGSEQHIGDKTHGSHSMHNPLPFLGQLAYFGFVCLLALILILDWVFSHRLALRQRLCRLLLGTLKTEMPAAMTDPEQDDPPSPERAPVSPMGPA